MFTNQTTNNGSEWDLSVLISNKNQDQLAEIFEIAIKRAEAIESEFKSKLHSDTILPMLERIEEMYLDVAEIYQYASLMVSADQTNKEAKELLSKAQNIYSTLGKKTVFVISQRE